VHDRGSDQGGRWPVGIWFALVGVSAGTVASFALIGWAFTRGLYTGEDASVPVEIEPETVVIKGEEPPATPGIEGIAGADPVPDGLAEPGAGIDPEPAEPQAEPISGGGADSEPGPALREVADSEDADEEDAEEPEPPRLVPIEEDAPCPPEESAVVPGPESSDHLDHGDDTDHWNGWDDPDLDAPDWSPDQLNDQSADHRLELELEL
jgi:hypothetical protein